MTSSALREMEDSTIFPAPKPDRKPWADKETYQRMYEDSTKNPEKFWAEQANSLDWIKKWDTVKNTSFEGDIHIRWFEGAELNVCYNCIDRHLKKRGKQTAMIWEGDDPNESKKITYNQLYKEVCRFANVLKKLEVKKGDTVTIYMPMIPEAAYAMLACTRIGAVHSVVFGGFSPEALKGRIDNCNSNIVITADEGRRGGKAIPLKSNTDKALDGTEGIKTLVIKILVEASSGTIKMISGITRFPAQFQMIALQKQWAQKIHYLSFIPPDQLVNQKVYCIRLLDIFFMHL